MKYLIKQMQEEARGLLHRAFALQDGVTDSELKMGTLITQTVERTLEAVVEMCEGKKPRNDIDIFYKYEGENNGQNKLKEAIYKSGYTRALDDIIHSLRTELLGNEKNHQPDRPLNFERE
jgi:hypothetical protein